MKTLMNAGAAEGFHCWREMGGKEDMAWWVGNEEAYVNRNHVTATSRYSSIPFSREWVQGRKKYILRYLLRSTIFQ
jgi:hypothetical protein